MVTFAAQGPHRMTRGLDQRKTQLVRKGAGHSPAPSYGEDRLSVGSPEDREGTGQVKGPGREGASVLEAAGKTGQKCLHARLLKSCLTLCDPIKRDT